MLKNKLIKGGVIVASLMVLVTASNPTYAAEKAKELLNDITFGKVSYFQNTEAGVEPLEDCYKGKIFDKDGKEVTSIDINAVYYDHTEKLYTKDGKEISYMKNGDIITVEDEMKNVTQIDNKDKISEYASFDYKLPTYVPEGYEFKNAEYEKKTGVTDGNEYYMEFLKVNYEDKSNGNGFSIDETFSEVPFALVNNKSMEQIKVNDNDGVLYETGTISWVMNDVSYTLDSQNLDKDAKLQIAESVK